MMDATSALLLALAAAALPLIAVAAPPSAGEIAATVDALYRERDAPTALERMDRLLRDGIAAAPHDYGLLWRAARLRFWEADDAPPEPKRALGREGWEIAERAVDANPTAIEGHYYAALCIGTYSQAVGILRALAEGLESRFNAHLDRVIAEAPDFERGGPYVAKGRYWYELPWPKRSLRKATEALALAIQRHPGHLRARLYLADVQLADGHDGTARVTVDGILQGDVAYDPPEGRRIQRLARALQARLGPTPDP